MPTTGAGSNGFTNEQLVLEGKLLEFHQTILERRSGELYRGRFVEPYSRGV